MSTRRDVPDKIKTEELLKLLRSEGLSLHGTKSERIARLRKYLSSGQRQASLSNFALPTTRPEHPAADDKANEQDTSSSIPNLASRNTPDPPSQALESTTLDSPPRVLESTTPDPVSQALDPYPSEDDPMMGDLVESFDHTRLDSSKYHNLSKPCYHVALLALIRDYVKYLRDCTTEGQLDEETASIDQFVAMIDNRTGWNLARLVVPEFKERVLDVLPENLSPCFAQLLHRVRHCHASHGPQDFDLRAQSVPQYERDLVWQRVESMVMGMRAHPDQAGEASNIARELGPWTNLNRMEEGGRR